MKSNILRSTALAGLVLLSACSTGLGGNAPAPVDVTRFHLNQNVARATIAVEPVDIADANAPDFWRYRAAVEGELARLGWNVVNTPGRSEQIALIDVEQGSREALAQRSPVSIGIGGSTGGWRSGLGGGISFGLGGGRSRELVSTLLEVSIRRRSDATVFWEGRALTEGRTGTVNSDPGMVIGKLANALFRDFPGESGRTIRVQ